MGKIDSFYITFNNPLTVYFSGQEVTGKVTLKLNDELKHKGIFIRFLGLTSVHWTETRRHYNSLTKTYNTIILNRDDSHKYFEFEFPLLQAPISEEDTKLAAGLHEYEFHQVLPMSLPTSMEGTYGRTRYTCSAYISRPWRFNPKCKAAFTVLELIDLNTLPSIGNPVNGFGSVPVRRLCCKSGSISANVSVNKQGFVSGETMHISARVENASTTKIKHSKATLTCVIKYRAGSYSRIESLKVAEVIRDATMEPDNVFHWEDEKLLIPPIHPTTIAVLSNLITIHYILKFSVVPSRIISRKLEIEIPITIGTIPLVDDFSIFNSSSNYHFPNSNFNISPPAYSEYPNLPPPTYEESMNGTVNIKDDNDEDDKNIIGNVDYVLRYLYYSSEA
ncbi:hypothetical protein CHUAL_008645 [Chamberlinius hualienensis]